MKKLISAMSLEEKIGQMFLVGFPEQDNGIDYFCKRLSKRPYGNVILFSHNADKPDFLRSKLADISLAIKNRTSFFPLIAADQEGGIVTRFRDGFTCLPGAMALSSAYLGNTISIEEIEKLASICAMELLSVGVNWNLAPVLDVNINKKNPVIGVRSFGDKAELVSKLSAAYIRGMEKMGIIATAKHFPGYGDVCVDPHLGLPVVSADFDRLERVEMFPFRKAISDSVGSIMTAHMLFPSLENEKIPATMSKAVITGLLREKMGYDGLIVTDCMEMKAVYGRYPLASLKAVKAGVDVLCISHTKEIQDEAFDSIVEAVRSGEILESRIDESVNRIISAKQRIANIQKQTEPSLLKLAFSKEAAAFSKKIALASASYLTSKPLPKLTDGFVFIEMPSGIRAAVEDNKLDNTICEQIINRKLKADCSVVYSDNIKEQSLDILQKINGSPVVLAVSSLSGNSKKIDFIKKIAEHCYKTNSELSFILLREPYDLELLPVTKEKHSVLCVYEYSRLSIDVVADILSGAKVSGKCPIEI